SSDVCSSDLSGRVRGGCPHPSEVPRRGRAVGPGEHVRFCPVHLPRRGEDRLRKTLRDRRRRGLEDGVLFHLDVGEAFRSEVGDKEIEDRIRSLTREEAEVELRMSHSWIHSLVTRSRVATPNSVNRARRPVGGLFDTRVACLSAVNLSGPVVFLVRYWVGRFPSAVSHHPWIRRRHPVEKTVDEDPPALRSKASERCNEPPGSVRDHGGQGGVLIHGRGPHLELDTQ